MFGETLGHRPAAGIAEPERGRDRGADQRRVGDRGERDPVDTFRVRVSEASRSLDREACLARAARAGQGQEPGSGADRAGPDEFDAALLAAIRAMERFEEKTSSE